MTIIPSLTRDERRKSVVSHAFPELHRKVINHICVNYHTFSPQTNPLSKDLLVYTKTSLDVDGRRHSIAIPLIPAEGVSSGVQRKESIDRGQRRMESINEIKDTSLKENTQNLKMLSVPTEDKTPHGTYCSSRRSSRRSSKDGRIWKHSIIIFLSHFLFQNSIIFLTMQLLSKLLLHKDSW